MSLMSLEAMGSRYYRSKFRQLITISVIFLMVLSLGTLIIAHQAQGYPSQRSPSSLSSISSPRQNNPPVAVIDSPQNGDNFEVEEVVHFDASSSSDPDNDPMTYSWNFGDGETGEGVTTTHAYATPWVPIVRLTVSDGEQNDTAVVVIVIGGGGGQNRPPSADIREPNNGDTFTVGELITFDGSNSSDPEEDPITYHWDFGDDNTSSNMIAVHSYGETSSYLVTLTVSDGFFNDSDRVVIFVNNTPPSADAGEDQVGYLGVPLIFDGSGSSDPDTLDSIVNYTWDLGDRAIKYGVNITHSYSSLGAYSVILTVTDQNGASDSDEMEVKIVNSPPVAVLKVNTPDTVVNTDIEFDATESYDIDGNIEDYYYNFGDGTETDWIYLPVVEHEYRSLGRYQITLQVRDDQSEVSEPFYLNITITEKINKAPTVNILYPEEDDSVAGIVTIRGIAEDEEGGIEEVAVKLGTGSWNDATIVNTVGNQVDWEYIWLTEEVSDGEYIVLARAYDGDKYSTEHSLRVIVNNRPTTFIELTVSLNPDTSVPGESVKVFGTAKYDTDVPVANTDVIIKIEETRKSWSTETNDQGKYSYDISAPTKAGKYTVNVYITDGTLENDISKKLTVMSPPELSIDPEDIKFSKSKPQEKDRVDVTVTIHNNGELPASATVSFYQDSVDTTTLFDSKSITVPAAGSVLVTAFWRAQAGTHEIIILISDIDPAELDPTNNQASQSITVTAAETPEDEEQKGGNLFDQFSSLPPIYRYSILGVIILIILIVIIAAALRASKSKKAKEPMDQTITGTPQEGKSKPVVPTLVIIFAILSIIMMGMAYIMPWYSFTGKMSVAGEEFEMEENFYITKIEFKDTLNDISESITWEKATEDTTSLDDLAGLYKNIQYILIAGIIMGIFLIIGAVLAIVRFSKKIAIIFGLIALIVCLIGPAYFMMQHPEAIGGDTDDEAEGDGPHKSFSGSIEQEIEGTDVTAEFGWGPGLGWYLAMGGFVFALLAFIFSLALPKPEKAKEPKQAPGQPQVPAGMVVFKPLDEDKEQMPVTAKPQPVKFESIDSKSSIKFETIQD